MKAKRPLAEANSLGHTVGSQDASHLNLTEGLSRLKQQDTSCLAHLLKHWTDDHSAVRADGVSPLSARARKPPLGVKPANEKEAQIAEKGRSHTPGVRTDTLQTLDFGSEALFKGSLDNYSLGRQIGQGAYATVKLSLQKSTNSKVAIKIYDKAKMLDPHRRRNVRREIEIMTQIDHPNCVRLLEAINSTKHVYLVMEYVSGGSLHGYLKQKPLRKLEEIEARKVFIQIVAGLLYCHSKSIAHRDIKLENILLDEVQSVKLIDFGFSTIAPAGTKSKMFCGTPSYMAPEIVARKEYCGSAADVWALGVLLFALLSGTFPFKGISDKDLYSKIQRGFFDIPVCVPPLARALIQKMLSMDPARRPTCAEILKHAWVANETQREPEETKHSTARDSSEKQGSIVASLFQKYHVQRKQGAIFGYTSRVRSSSRPRDGKEN